ncbi:CoA ester lyase [Nocardia uniformis]|uniref:CoA ester lyase n=1 Tax=Nocardia uniformis TaxID=53432 RepID=A0A849BZ96_9NOCA|nr:CoA ester lyase [Nocardia uniformis]NNH70466.1 CoA ester lyase [Nocardia uniformis]
MYSDAIPRCWLSVPASRPALLAKAVSTEVDGIIVDLEDAVAPTEKAAARAGLATTLAESGLKADTTRLTVRINAPRSRWCHLDVGACVSAATPMDIMVPKVESAGDIAFIDRLLDGIELESGRVEPIGVQALIESATGLANIREIATASPRLRALVIGYADLGASLGRSARISHDRWLYAQETVLVAARTAGLAAIDGPYLGVEVDTEFRARVERAAELGFDGKWVIHPRQVASATAAFTPAPEAVASARAVLKALRDSHERGLGAVTVDGAMIDEAVAVSARRTLARARDATV